MGGLEGGRGTTDRASVFWLFCFLSTLGHFALLVHLLPRHHCIASHPAQPGPGSGKMFVVGNWGAV